MFELHPGFYDRFVELFEALKGRTKRHSKIGWYWRREPQVREIIQKIAEMNRDWRRIIASDERNSLSTVPQRFSATYREFEERWETEVMVEASRIEFLDIFGFDLGPERAQGSHLDHHAVTSLEPPDYEEDEAFYPTVHDPAAALDGLIRFAESKLDAYEGDDDVLANQIRIGLGAFDWYVKTNSINFAGIARRRRMISPVLLPPQISDCPADKIQLNQLLDDAARAFIHGAFCASILMCRTIAERVLRDHFLGMDNTNERVYLDELVKRARTVPGISGKCLIDELYQSALSETQFRDS